MHTKQTIAIIGTAEKGRTIAEALSASKERVLLFDKDANAASSLADELKNAQTDFDVEALSCSADACWEADVIILTIAQHEQASVATYIRDYANQKIVVTISGETQDAKALQPLLPHSYIIRASINEFSNECKIEGKDAEAIETTAALFHQMGFVPVTVACSKQLSTDDTIAIV